MENVKSNIKGVVGSSTNGIALTRLENDYFLLTNTHLKYQSHGYTSLRQFVESIPDVVKIVDTGDQPVVQLAVTKDDSKCLKNLLNLVNNGAIKKNNRINGSQNIKNNYQILRQFKISLANGMCSKIVSDTQKGFSIEKHTTITSNLNKENSNKSVNSINGASEYFDYGSWLVKPVINYEVFDKQVKVLGIQSGHVVVFGCDTELCSVLIQTCNITTVFPGDIVLWQPPFIDNDRLNNLVDITTSFPSTIIRRINFKKVQVRIMGLVTLLEVSMCDLFAMPTSYDLSDLIKSVQSRELTLVCIALLPTTINIWDNDAYSGVYHIFFSIEEGGSILERSDDRGNFLNLSLLKYIEEKLVLSNNIEEKRSFLDHISHCIGTSKVQLLPSYKRLLLLGRDRGSVPFSMAHNIDECINKKLVGSKALIATYKDSLDMFALPTEALTLDRFEFRSVRSSFFGYDDRVAITVAQEWPLVALFLINEDFIRSTVTKTERLRFMTALLAHLPSIGRLTIDLGLQD